MACFSYQYQSHLSLIYYITFQREKLDWLNGQYLKQLPDETLLSKIEEVAPFQKSVPKERVLRALGCSALRFRSAKR